jgi:hypothetical protein
MPILEVIMVNDGIMSLVIGIWEEKKTGDKLCI